MVYGIIPAQRFVQAGQPLMGLAIGTVKFDKGARQGRGVRRHKAKICQGRICLGKNRVGQGFAHIADQAFAVAQVELGHVDAKFLGEGQNHRCADRAVVVLHLIEIGPSDTQFRRKILLRQGHACAHFA